MDLFGARYYSGAQGRFTSPDPLLNAGKPWEPQSWNRYTYVLNNPLKYIDPTGLYELQNDCLQDDKDCNKRFNDNAKRLRNALEELRKKVYRTKDPSEKLRLDASLKALGAEGDRNGVFVSFKPLGLDTAATTEPFDAGNGNINYLVTFDPAKFSGRNNLAINAAHEGTHVMDFSNPRYNDPTTTLSTFSLEYRAYQTSAWAAKALGQSPLAFGGHVIWNNSWTAVDRLRLMDAGIAKYLTTRPRDPLPESLPHNPWP